MGPVVEISCSCLSEAESCRIVLANVAADTEGFSFTELNKCTMGSATREYCGLLVLSQALLGDNIFGQII